MMKARKICFHSNDLWVEMSFGTYALMMYYGAQIDGEKNKRLFEATLTEWSYRMEKGIPKEEYTSHNEVSHFVETDVREAICFIDEDILPALQEEPFDYILDKFGGKQFFEEMAYYESYEYLLAIGICDEFYNDGKDVLQMHFAELRNVFQEELKLNEPMHIHIH